MAIIQGTLRADRRTKDLVKRLKPGDIALIHHLDLDSTAARSLVDCRVSAVVNAAQSISGRYPNQGPAIIVDAGIPLIDAVGEEFFAQAAEREGTAAAIDGDALRLADGACVVGVRLTPAAVAQQTEAARANLDRELESFAQNTLEFIREEKALLLDPVGLPEISTAIRGKPTVVVVRGEGYKEDLRAITQYLHDVRPVLIGVDGGADALIEVGLKPNLIIGDMDSVSDEALKCGAELIVHGYVRGERKAPGLERLEKLGLDTKVFHAPGTSEDIAILLADEKGASLIVAVGTHFSLVEFLDKGRGGMASTFLVRLRTGSKLVDAKGIARLWDTRPRIAPRDIFIIVAAALFPVGVVAFYSPWLRTVINTLRLSLRSTFGLH
jgi:uncharacterized membrane-anchored protein